MVKGLHQPLLRDREKWYNVRLTDKCDDRRVYLKIRGSSGSQSSLVWTQRCLAWKQKLGQYVFPNVTPVRRVIRLGPIPEVKITNPKVTGTGVGEVSTK